MKQLSLLLFVVLVVGCVDPFSKEFGKIEGATEVWLEIDSLSEDRIYNDQVDPITDPALVQRLEDEVNNAKDIGPGKGLITHKLIFFKGDMNWEIYVAADWKTLKGKGDQQYEMKSENILKEYWNIDTNRK